jgi:hypothetical protein
MKELLKKREKSIEKMGKCLNYQNKGYIDAHLKKKEKEINKIVHVFLQMFPSFKREISFQEA